MGEYDGPTAVGAQTGQNSRALLYGTNSRPPTMPPPSPQRITVEQALEIQQQAANELHGTLSDLESRLHSVLEPVPGTDGAVPKDIVPSNLVERILLHSRTIACAAARVQQLRDRLQL